jgi:hypothetical protein
LQLLDMVPHIVALPKGNGRRRRRRRLRLRLRLLPLPRGRRLQGTRRRRPESIRRPEHTEQAGLDARRLRNEGNQSSEWQARRRRPSAPEPGGIIRKPPLDGVRGSWNWRSSRALARMSGVTPEEVQCLGLRNGDGGGGDERAAGGGSAALHTSRKRERGRRLEAPAGWAAWSWDRSLSWAVSHLARPVGLV